MLLLRLLHIVLGIFWAGSIFFMAIFLEPVLRSLGPDGGKVMNGLALRRHHETMMAIALLTNITGLWMYWRDSVGTVAFGGSPIGMALGLGGLTSLIALLIGAFVTRPTAIKMNQLGLSLPTAAPADRERMMGELQKLRGRLATTIRTVATLVLVSSAMMAVARYL